MPLSVKYKMIKADLSAFWQEDGLLRLWAEKYRVFGGFWAAGQGIFKNKSNELEVIY